MKVTAIVFAVVATVAAVYAQEAPVGRVRVLADATPAPTTAKVNATTTTPTATTMTPAAAKSNSTASSNATKGTTKPAVKSGASTLAAVGTASALMAVVSVVY